MMMGVFEDDLFLYEDFDEEEKAIVVAAFGEKDNEALVIILSCTYSILLFSNSSVFTHTHTTECDVYMRRGV